MQTRAKSARQSENTQAALFAGRYLDLRKIAVSIMDTGEDPERGRPSPSYPIYDRSGVTGAAESFGQQTSDVLGTLSLLSTASGSGSTRLPPTVPSLDADHARLAKQSHVDAIMSSVDAMREELGRSPKDLATAA